MSHQSIPANVTGRDVETYEVGERVVAFTRTEGVWDSSWTVIVDRGGTRTLLATGDGSDTIEATFVSAHDGGTWRLLHAGVERLTGIVRRRPLRDTPVDDEVTIAVDDGDTVVEMTVVGGGGGASVHVGPDAPVSPAEGDMWWDITAGALFVRVDDAWVETTSEAPVASVNGKTGAVVLGAADVGAVDVSVVGAAGDLLVGVGSGVVGVVGVGAAGSVLVSDGEMVGWAPPPSGVDEVAVPAPVLAPGAGNSPGLSFTRLGNSVSETRIAWSFAADATTTSSSTLRGYVPPLPWAAVDIWIDWLSRNAGTGGVRWALRFGGLVDASVGMPAYPVTGQVTTPATSTTYGDRWTVQAASDVAVPAGMLTLSIARDSEHADDTIAGTADLAQIRFREAGT